MAFVTRSSRALVQIKFGRLDKRNTIIRHTCYNKVFSYIDSSLTESHHHYSTNSAKALFLYSVRKPGVSLSTFNISSIRHLSSDSHETLQVFTTEPLNKDTGTTDAVGSSTDKVLFIETPQVSETPPISAETVTSQVADSSGFISDSAANVALSSDLPSVAAAIAEPSLASLGLVNWTPVGLVQKCLEILHVDAGMPWWMTIVAATVICRVLMLPIFIKAQKNSIRVANYMPEMQFLQAKFTEARKTGNAYEATKCSQEMMDFMKKHDVNPLKNMLIPLSQAPVFISFFLALRGMAKVPVPSMSSGGLWWITDLTIPDPYYIMPLVACSTLYVILKVGAESGMRMDDLKLSRYVLKAMPVIAFPFCINFESAVLFYWCTNNFLSLGLVSLLKIEKLRTYFGIGKIKPPPKLFATEKKGFVQGLRESMDNHKILQSMEDRRRIDQVQFKKAGTGPIPRTYSYDPTKMRPANAAAAARQKQTKA